METEAGEKGETWIQVGSLFAPKLSHQHTSRSPPPSPTLSHWPRCGRARHSDPSPRLVGKNLKIIQLRDIPTYLTKLLIHNLMAQKDGDGADGDGFFNKRDWNRLALAWLPHRKGVLFVAIQASPALHCHYNEIYISIPSFILFL